MIPGEQLLGKEGGPGLDKSGCLTISMPLRTTRTEQQSAPLCVAFYSVTLSSSQASTQCIPRKSQEGL